jgi:hypothetical protein
VTRYSSFFLLIDDFNKSILIEALKEIFWGDWEAMFHIILARFNNPRHQVDEKYKGYEISDDEKKKYLHFPASFNTIIQRFKCAGQSQKMSCLNLR